MPHFTLKRQNGTVRWDPHDKTFEGWKTHRVNFLNNSDVTVDVEIADALNPVPDAPLHLGAGKKGHVDITANATNAPKPEGGRYPCKTKSSATDGGELLQSASTARAEEDGDPVIIIKP